MSDHIDTSDGWREVPIDGMDPWDLIEYDDSGDMKRAWVRVREEPVPPLPTEIATLDGADLIFVSEVLRALGTWKQAQR